VFRFVWLHCFCVLCLCAGVIIDTCVRPHVNKYPLNSIELNKITLFIVNVRAGAGTSNPLTPIHAAPAFFIIRRYAAYMTIDPSLIQKSQDTQRCWTATWKQELHV
jgi:hypothetical protein